MGDRFDTEETTEKFLETEKRIARDVSDWKYQKIWHPTTKLSLKQYEQIKGRKP